MIHPEEDKKQRNKEQEALIENKCQDGRLNPNLSNSYIKFK